MSVGGFSKQRESYLWSNGRAGKFNILTISLKYSKNIKRSLNSCASTAGASFVSNPIMFGEGALLNK